MDVLPSTGEPEWCRDIHILHKTTSSLAPGLKERKKKKKAIKEELGAGPVTILQKGQVHARVLDTEVSANQGAFLWHPGVILLRASFSRKVKKSFSLQGLEKAELGQTEKSCPHCFSFQPERWTIQRINKEATDVLVPVWKVKRFIYPKRLKRIAVLMTNASTP